jgi:hypothetical protein
MKARQRGLKKPFGDAAISTLKFEKQNHKMVVETWHTVGQSVPRMTTLHKLG